MGDSPMRGSPDEECSDGCLSDSSYEDDYTYEDSGGGQIDSAGSCEDSAVESSSKVAFTFVPQLALLERIIDQSKNLAALLSTTEGQAVALLAHCGWDESRLHDKWFTEESALREKTGVLDSQSIRKQHEIGTCQICFDEFSSVYLFQIGCNHLFCKECWKSYLDEAVSSKGACCLDLRCPIPNCPMLVRREQFYELGGSAIGQCFDKLLVKKYVEDSHFLKWCPGPDCVYASEMNDPLDEDYSQMDKPVDLTCVCGHFFCWNCLTEAHRPVDCETVKKWLRKNSAESENLNWILAHSKPCPKCKRPIEKNQGCNHMTCSACKFEFCWMCLGDWRSHGEATGGYYSCNAYEITRKRGEISEGDRRRESAKHSLSKYLHYYERWSAHESSRKIVHKKREEYETKYPRLFSELTSLPASQFKFITEAWSQVVDCRRILKWTYAFSYYCMNNKEDPRVEFFEFKQGEAEHQLENLNGLIENELHILLESAPDKGFNLESFHAYRTKTVGLTAVTKEYFKKLVEELEKNEWSSERKESGRHVNVLNDIDGLIKSS